MNDDLELIDNYLNGIKKPCQKESLKDKKQRLMKFHSNIQQAKQKQSKIKDIEYMKLEPQKYIQSKDFSEEEMVTLFALS